MFLNISESWNSFHVGLKLFHTVTYILSDIEAVHTMKKKAGSRENLLKIQKGVPLHIHPLKKAGQPQNDKMNFFVTRRSKKIRLGGSVKKIWF
ncbi:hypothetical protein GCM10020331_000640 [Ectobacillus funiculus]